jgi:hypothetical protein
MATAVGGFQTVTLEDFSLGSVQSVARHLIPPGGCYEIRNGLLSQEGTIFLRGGSANWANADGPDTGGVRGLWAGQLTPGQRVLAWTNAHTFAFAAGSTTPVSLTTTTPGKPVRGSAIDGILFLDGGIMWGGSLKAADYSTGTVAITQGDDVVTGTGTSWTANVDVGMLFNVPSKSPQKYVVKSIDSNTQITLTHPFFDTTGSGVAYTLKRFESATGVGSDKTPIGYLASGVYATVGGKLLVADGSKVWESDPPSDTGFWHGIFQRSNYVQLPDGNAVVGIAGLRGNALVFGSQGLFLLSNVALDIEDASGNPQQSLQQLSADLKLWGKEGLASWQNRVIAPCVDDIYLIDGVSAPQPISKSITNKYQSYVRLGYKPGLASVSQNHYSLPILDEFDVPHDCLVCKLDRPTRTRYGVFFPWSFIDGSAANITSTAVLNTTGSAPILLAGSKQTTSRVLNLSKWFTISDVHANRLDHDSTIPVLSVTFPDIPTGPGPKIDNLVRFVRLYYTLDIAAVDIPLGGSPPTLGVSYAQEPTFVGSPWVTAGDAPANNGSGLVELGPWTAGVNQMARLFRPRVVSAGPVAGSLVIAGLEMDVLPKRR